MKTKARRYTVEEARKNAKAYSKSSAIRIACSTKDRGVATTSMCVDYQKAKSNVDRTYQLGKRLKL